MDSQVACVSRQHPCVQRQHNMPTHQDSTPVYQDNVPMHKAISVNMFLAQKQNTLNHVLHVTGFALCNFLLFLKMGKITQYGPFTVM